MPPSRAALRAAAESATAKEGVSREDQLLPAQNTAPLPTPQPSRSHPERASAAEESAAGSHNNSARPPDPLPGRRGRRGRRGRGTGRTGAGKVGPRHLWGRGDREGGRRGCRRGGSRQGGGGARRDAETGTLATQELLRRETKGWRGGGEGARHCYKTRPQRRIERVRKPGRLDGERGGLEAERTRKTGKWRAMGGGQRMGLGLR